MTLGYIKHGIASYSTHLCKVKVHEAEGEELQADREAVKQPEGKRSQSVGRDKVLEVEGEEHGAQGRPQQAQGQKHGLVAEALVPVPQDQPELDVDEDEEEGVKDGVDHSKTQSDVGRHRRTQGGQRHGLVHRRRVLLLHRGLHDLLSQAVGGESGAEGPLPVFAAGSLSALTPGRGEARAAAEKMEKIRP